MTGASTPPLDAMLLLLKKLLTLLRRTLSCELVVSVVRGRRPVVVLLSCGMGSPSIIEISLLRFETFPSEAFLNIVDSRRLEGFEGLGGALVAIVGKALSFELATAGGGGVIDGETAVGSTERRRSF